MIHEKRRGIMFAAAVFAAVVLAACVFSGAAAAEDNASYAINIPEELAGLITTSPATTANAGATVTVTITLPSGTYLVEGTLMYTKEDGTEPHPIEKRLTKYTFTMPSYNIVISAQLWKALNGGAFYYENVAPFSGSYKYLDNVIYLDTMDVLEPSASRPEGTYASTTTTDGFILKKLDADVFMYVYDDYGNKISSVIDGTVPRGSKVSFKIDPNLPTIYSKPDGWDCVGLKFIKPDGTVSSTHLGSEDLSATGSWSPENGLESEVITLDETLEEGTWTVYVYFVPVDKPGFFVPYTPDSYLNGTKFHFTISSSTVTMTAEPGVIQEGKDFILTVTGKPNEMYYLKRDVKYKVNPGQDHVQYPMGGEYYPITIGQTGSTILSLKAVKHGSLLLKLYEEPDSSFVTDDCKVEITKAGISAFTDKDSYYLGNDVKLTGKNDSNIYPLYYYIEGPNFEFRQIPADGLKLTKTGTEWETTVRGSYISGQKPDAGTYTIYVSSEDSKDKADVVGADGVSTSVSVKFIKPLITLTTVPTVVVQDENLRVNGVAESASQVLYYIFGTNKFTSGYTDVGRYGEFIIDIPVRKNEFASGQYFMVVQHPMYDGYFNIAPGKDADEREVIALNYTDNAVDSTWHVKDGSHTLFSLSQRQSANAAQALCDAIDTENIDDMYAKTSFIVNQAETTVDPIPSQIEKGLPVTVSGVSTRADDTTISIELLSTAFTPESKYSATSASFITLITHPDPNGRWAATFNTSGLNADDYTITVSANSTVVQQTPIRITMGTATVTKTPTQTVPTAAPVTQTQPTPAKAPGFGIAAVIAGLGAGAILLRGRRE